MKRLPQKRLIVTADDFGMSLEVNEAVEEAHRNGILTCASLAVTGAAAEDAVRRAKRMPDLGVGLHLALYGALAASPEVSPLAPDGRNLGSGAFRTAAAIMLSPRAREAARREIAAQFEAYRRTGLPLGHLDGHWHCQENPAVLAIALEFGRPLGLKGTRVPYEPYGFSHDAAGGEQSAVRALHAIGHWPIAALMRRQIRAAGIIANDRFFGKTDAGHVDETVLLRLAERLPRGLTELGLHPATKRWSGDHVPPADWQPAAELAALTSPAVRAALDRAGVTLCRWQDVT